MTHSFEREFAAGLAVLVLVSVIAARLAVTNFWADWAGTILKP